MSKPVGVISLAYRRCRGKRLIRRTTYCKPLNISWRKRWLVATASGLDLERTVIRAPADGWVTNLNVYTGEFITRGSTAVALVKENTFYVMAYLEETKLEGVRPGYRAEITPLGSSKTIKGTVDSIAAG